MIVGRLIFILLERKYLLCKQKMATTHHEQPPTSYPKSISNLKKKSKNVSFHIHIRICISQ
nr:MAG TPA: hypothetical protein [Caudoviricetes sp.]